MIRRLILLLAATALALIAVGGSAWLLSAYLRLPRHLQLMLFLISAVLTAALWLRRWMSRALYRTDATLWINADSDRRAARLERQPHRRRFANMRHE